MHHITDIMQRLVKRPRPAECPGCGRIVQSAVVLGRIRYACDPCANRKKKELTEIGI